MAEMRELTHEKGHSVKKRILVPDLEFNFKAD